MNTKHTYEFTKLDAIDLKVACWLYAESPAELYGFLEYLADQRYKFRGIDLNVHKAFHQLAEVTIKESTNASIPITQNVHNKNYRQIRYAK